MVKEIARYGISKKRSKHKEVSETDLKDVPVVEIKQKDYKEGTLIVDVFNPFYRYGV